MNKENLELIASIPPLVILTSRHSSYGAQVLKECINSGFIISRIYIEQRPARGGLTHLRYYLLKYGLSAVLARSMEFIWTFFNYGLFKRSDLCSIEKEVYKYGIPLEFVKNYNDPTYLNLFAKEKSSIVLAAGIRILNSTTLQYFPLGVYNAHPGLLPEYRGNYPVRWSLLNQEPCGVTVYRMEAGLDAGPILIKKEVKIRQDESLWEFESRITALCAELLVSSIKKYLSGELSPVPQKAWDRKPYGLMGCMNLVKLYKKLKNNKGMEKEILPE